jgi:hypothetical protein
MLGIFAEASPTTSPLARQISEITIGSRPAARAESTIGQDQALLIVLALQPGAFAILVGGAAPGELARFEPTLLAIAETMQYSPAAPVSTPPAAPETLATEEAGG